MPIRVQSSGIFGVEDHPVEVEVDVAQGGVPSFETVGLPDTAVRESRQRVRAALRNSGFDVPKRRTTVNLSPADLKKEGTSYDLPIALGLLVASRQLQAPALPGALLVGELGLGGRLRPVRGGLAMVIGARRRGMTRAVVPAENAIEARGIDGIDVWGARTLAEAAALLAGTQDPEPLPSVDSDPGWPPMAVDLAHVRGQAAARRAIEIAASGSHNLLLSGSPGVGKTLLARALMGLLPRLSLEEQLEVSCIHSVAGLLHGTGLIRHRPFRAPHHTASVASMVGGGSGIPRPGEVSLAHRGVLFVDEFPEFPRPVRECLRQPLETGEVTIARSRRTVSFPARFQLVATMNPCPCGYYGVRVPGRPCRCSETSIARYRERVSGPLADRFDLRVHCPPVPRSDLLSTEASVPTSEVRPRIRRARERQAHRYRDTPFVCNADVTGDALNDLCRLDDSTHRLIDQMMDRGLSARGYHRIVRVARTIADLDNEETVTRVHMAEAFGLRV